MGRKVLFQSFLLGMGGEGISTSDTMMSISLSRFGEFSLLPSLPSWKLNQKDPEHAMRYSATQLHFQPFFLF